LTAASAEEKQAKVTIEKRIPRPTRSPALIGPTPGEAADGDDGNINHKGVRARKAAASARRPAT
jgi:hypothetical protein